MLTDFPAALIDTFHVFRFIRLPIMSCRIFHFHAAHGTFRRLDASWLGDALIMVARRRTALIGAFSVLVRPVMRPRGRDGVGLAADGAGHAPEAVEIAVARMRTFIVAVSTPTNAVVVAPVMTSRFRPVAAIVRTP